MTYDEKLKLADAARCGFLGSKIEYTPIMDCKPTARKRWLRVVDAVLSGSRVPMLEIKVKNQRMELRNLYGLREQEAIATQKLRAEVAALNDALASVEVELADKAFYVTEFAAVSKERDELKAEIASLRQVETRPVKVRWSVKHGEFADKMSAVVGANVATEIAANVLSLAAEHAVIDVPPGMPILRDLREIGVRAYLSQDSAKRENAGCLVDPMGAAASAIRDAVIAGMQRPAGMPSVDDVAAMLWNFDGPHGWDYSPEECPVARREAQSILDCLAPWLREQPGWELDVTWQDLYNTYQTKLCGLQGSWEAILDLCRSRIRPVYECKECAKKEAEYQDLINATNDEAKRINRAMDAINAARAALEDE